MRHGAMLGELLASLGTRKKKPAATSELPAAPRDWREEEAPRKADAFKPDMYVDMYGVIDHWAGFNVATSLSSRHLRESSGEKQMRQRVMDALDAAIRSGEIEIKASPKDVTFGYAGGIMINGGVPSTDYNRMYLGNYHVRAGDLMRIAKETGLDHPRMERSLYRLETGLIDGTHGVRFVAQSDLRDVSVTPAVKQDHRVEEGPDGPGRQISSIQI